MAPTSTWWAPGTAEFGRLAPTGWRWWPAGAWRGSRVTEARHLNLPWPFPAEPRSHLTAGSTLPTRKIIASGKSDGTVSTLTRSPATHPPTSTAINHPIGLAVDLDGNVLVANAGSNNILRISGSTTAVTVIAGDGTTDIDAGTGAATTVHLYRPSG